MVGRQKTTLVLILALFAAVGWCSSSYLPRMIASIPPQEKFEDLAENSPIIVFDYSHGQYYSYIAPLDLLLETELENLGYTVVWAWGGINSTILSNASGLVIGSIWEVSNAFLMEEILAIQAWFLLGEKFLWVGTDSDYSGYTYINNNMNLILQGIGSHVYPEPTSIEDPVSNCNASYRVIANGTTENEFVAPIVANVSGVLMHGPTLLYGSNSSTSPGVDVAPVALETVSIEDVFPLLYYSEYAQILDSDTVPPLAHNDGDSGAFVCATLETNLGIMNNSVVIVSGSSPYGMYQPMFTSDYYGKNLDGDLFVKQAIEFGMLLVGQFSITHPPDMTYEEGAFGNYIAWQAFDLNPRWYNITLDHTLIREGVWNRSSEFFIVSIDGLSRGIYNYTLSVENVDNVSLSDTVFVTVVEQHPPTVNHPEDMSIFVGDRDSQIVWTVSDQSLLYYNLSLDGEVVLTEILLSVQSKNVIVGLDDLPLGVHNYTIQVIDRALLQVTDTVIIDVLDMPSSNTSTTTITSTTSTTIGEDSNLLQTVTLIISIGSVAVIMVMMILVFRKR